MATADLTSQNSLRRPGLRSTNTNLDEPDGKKNLYKHPIKN